jgi:hypothetical protein
MEKAHPQSPMMSTHLLIIKILRLEGLNGMKGFKKEVTHYERQN